MLKHSINSDAAFLLITGSEAFRSREAESWAGMRETLSEVRASGTEALGEISADLTNSCMDLMDITR